MKEVLLASRFDNNENAEIQKQFWNNLLKRGIIATLSFCESKEETVALYSINISEPNENLEATHISPTSRLGWFGIE